MPIKIQVLPILIGSGSDRLHKSQLFPFQIHSIYTLKSQNHSGLGSSFPPKWTQLMLTASKISWKQSAPITQWGTEGNSYIAAFIHYCNSLACLSSSTYELISSSNLDSSLHKVCGVIFCLFVCLVNLSPQCSKHSLKGFWNPSYVWLEKRPRKIYFFFKCSCVE